MIKLNQAVIVEGKYDKITLSNIIDGVIITTDGFKIFKDADKKSLIRLFAKTVGIVVITDSDYAGDMIRAHIKNICGSTDNVFNVYVPQLKGKERRKATPSKQGFLGVEGMSKNVIIKCLLKSGVTAASNGEKTRKISKNDLFFLGLSGCENSAEKRRAICRFLNLPETLSSSAFLDAINTLYGYEKFLEVAGKWRQETDKN